MGKTRLIPVGTDVYRYFDPNYVSTEQKHMLRSSDLQGRGPDGKSRKSHQMRVHATAGYLFIGRKVLKQIRLHDQLPIVLQLAAFYYPYGGAGERVIQTSGLSAKTLTRTKTTYS